MGEVIPATNVSGITSPARFRAKKDNLDGYMDFNLKAKAKIWP
jgi:hypothetical protein